MNDISQQPTETNDTGDIFQRIRKDSMVHLIFAALLAIFVTAGYFPSPDGPKYEPVERREIPAAASAETRVAIDKENAEIDKKNTEAQQKVAKDQRAWEKSGRENYIAMTTLARFAAGLCAALWVVFFVCSYLVRPLLKFLRDFLGQDFAKVITPIVFLGIAYVLAQIILQSTSGKEVIGHGFVVTVIQFTNHILRPFLRFIIDSTEFIVKNWTVGLIYLAIVVYAIIRKFKKPVE